MCDRLKELADAGVSIWLDDLSRERIETGNLAELVKERSVVGVTTNPTIFAAAIAEGERYDEQVAQLVDKGEPVDRVVFELTTERRPQRLRRPARRCTRRRPYDGRVSIEVDPDLANDTEATLAVGPRAVGRGRPAERADQDPGDPRGAARDHRRDSPRASAST